MVPVTNMRYASVISLGAAVRLLNVTTMNSHMSLQSNRNNHIEYNYKAFTSSHSFHWAQKSTEKLISARLGVSGTTTPT